MKEWFRITWLVVNFFALLIWFFIKFLWDELKELKNKILRGKSERVA